MQFVVSNVESNQEKAKKKFDSSVSKSDEKDRKRLFVKNLPYSLTEDLQKVFPFATSVKLPRRKDDSKLKGYGYIEFPDEQTADENLKKLQNVVVGGRALKLSKIVHKEKKVTERPAVPTCLLVKQLPFSLMKDRLKKTFEKSVSARIVLDPETKKSRGFGFVEFENEEDALSAMNEMQGRELDGRKMVISTALKKSTPSRREKMANKKKGREETLKKLKKSEELQDDGAD